MEMRFFFVSTKNFCPGHLVQKLVNEIEHDKFVLDFYQFFSFSWWHKIWYFQNQLGIFFLPFNSRMNAQNKLINLLEQKIRFKSKVYVYSASHMAKKYISTRTNHEESCWYLEIFILAFANTNLCFSKIYHITN